MFSKRRSKQQRYLLYLQQLVELNQMGLSLKQCFESIERVHPSLKSMNTWIYNKTQKGVPVHVSLQQLSQHSLASLFSIPHVDIQQWIPLFYDYEKHCFDLENELINELKKPVLFICLSIVINIVLLQFFIPHVQQLFNDIASSPPTFILIIEHSMTLLSNYHSTLIIGLCLLLSLIFPLIKKWVKKWVKHFIYPLFISRFLLEMAGYLKQHIDLKHIIEHIEIKKTHLFFTTIQDFKHRCFTKHDVKQALLHLLANSHHHSIIEHSYQTNRLYKGLHYVGTYYQKQFFDHLKQKISRLSVYLLMITGFSIATAFYITLLPLQYLVQTL